jgi:hypothetical protein
MIEKIAFVVLLAVSVMLPFAAGAEGRCPPGSYPAGGQGVGGCAPHPGVSSEPAMRCSAGSCADITLGNALNAFSTA